MQCESGIQLALIILVECFVLLLFITAFVRSAAGKNTGLKSREEEAMKSFARLSAVSLPALSVELCNQLPMSSLL